MTDLVLKCRERIGFQIVHHKQSWLLLRTSFLKQWKELQVLCNFYCINLERLIKPEVCDHASRRQRSMCDKHILCISVYRQFKVCIYVWIKEVHSVLRILSNIQVSMTEPFQNMFHVTFWKSFADNKSLIAFHTILIIIILHIVTLCFHIVRY